MAYQRFLNRFGSKIIGYLSLKVYLILPLLLFFLGISGCATSITFRVLDAQTKEPIEGAVAIAMWEATKGLPGLTYSYTDKAIEAESDQIGYFSFPSQTGKYAVVEPRIKVYKPGYVGWDSTLIYLGCHKNNRMTPIYEERRDFSMKNQDIYLEPWKDEYTFISHGSFISTNAILHKEAGLISSKYERAIRYETPFVTEEWKEKNKK